MRQQAAAARTAAAAAGQAEPACQPASSQEAGYGDKAPCQAPRAAALVAAMSATYLESAPAPCGAIAWSEVHPGHRCGVFDLFLRSTQVHSSCVTSLLCRQCCKPGCMCTSRPAVSPQPGAHCVRLQIHAVWGCATVCGRRLIRIAVRPQDNLLAVATARSVILLSAGHLGGPRSALDVPPPGKLPSAGAHWTAPSGGSQVTECIISSKGANRPAL